MDTDTVHTDIALTRIAEAMLSARRAITIAMDTAVDVAAVANLLPSVKEQTADMAERMYEAAQSARDIEAGLAQLHKGIRSRAAAEPEQ